MRCRILCFVLVALLVAVPSVSLAHSGRTDSKGGHYDRSTGEYHYHHGYGPHDHPGGVCPYDTSSSVSVLATATPKPMSKLAEPGKGSKTVDDYMAERALRLASATATPKPTKSPTRAPTATPSKTSAGSPLAAFFPEESSLHDSLFMLVGALFLTLLFAVVLTAVEKRKRRKAEALLRDVQEELKRTLSSLAEMREQLDSKTSEATRLSNVLKGKETLIAMIRRRSDEYHDSVVELQNELSPIKCRLLMLTKKHQELVAIWENHLLENDPFIHLHYEARVYVRKENASKYHTTIHCGDAKNYKLIPLRNAMEKGYSPCLQCFTSMPKEYIVSQYMPKK